MSKINISIPENCCYLEIEETSCQGNSETTLLYPPLSFQPNELGYFITGKNAQRPLYQFQVNECSDVCINGVEVTDIQQIHNAICCVNDGVEEVEETVLCGSLNLNLIGGGTDTWTHEGEAIQGTWFTLADILVLSNATYRNGSSLTGDHYICDFSITALKCGLPAATPLTETSVTIKKEFNFAVVQVNNGYQIQTNGGNVTMEDGEQFQRIFIPQGAGIKFTSGKFCQIS